MEKINCTLIFHLQFRKFRQLSILGRGTIMILTYPDYTKLVVAAFKKRQQDSMNPLLPNITRTEIRKECLNVYKERLNRGEREEKDVLKKFFGVPPEGKDFSNLIENCEPDKFRPLQSLMRGNIKTPLTTNVELLAWLIDFKHRPYTTGMHVLLNDEELAIVNITGPTVDPPPPVLTVPGTKSVVPLSDEGKLKLNSRRSKTAAIILLGLGLVGGTVAWLGKGDTTRCMYWSGDHYEKVACNEKKESLLLLPVDDERLKSFKKITRPDTIRNWSIGIVHYRKKNNRYEFFTTGGKHPVEITYNLRKLSRYIYDSVLCNNKKLSEIMSYTQPENISVTSN